MNSDPPAAHRILPAAMPLEPTVRLLWLVALAYLVGDGVAAYFDGTGLSSLTVGRTIFLVAAAAALSVFSVRMPIGYITLSGVATNAAALTLSPRPALLVGLVAGVVMISLSSRSPLVARICQVLAVGLWTSAGAWLNQFLTAVQTPGGVREPLIVVTVALLNLLLTGLIGMALLRYGLVEQISRNASRHWTAAFAYFGAASILIASLLDGTARGFLLSSLVAVLSLALGDSVAGRELRVRLQAQLKDAERHVLHSRVVEGTIHDVRNFLAVGLGQLDESIAESGSASAVLARTAFRDAVESLNRLQMGSSPNLTWASDPVELTDVAHDVASLISATAHSRRVSLSIEALGTGAVNGDPLLLRQVVTNLVLNAIEAVASGGNVWVRIGTRGAHVCLSVIDDGPGVPDKYRDRLFEPHFTTKATGSGIGLFVSYGIIQKHGGDLLYEGSKRGAVFTILLPLS